MCPPHRLFRWQSLVGICLVSGLMMAAWPSAVLAKIDIKQNSGVVAGDPGDGLGYMDFDGGGGGGVSDTLEEKTFTPADGRVFLVEHFLVGALWIVPAPAGHFLPLYQFGPRRGDSIVTPWMPQGVPTQ